MTSSRNFRVGATLCVQARHRLPKPQSAPPQVPGSGVQVAHLVVLGIELTELLRRSAAMLPHPRAQARVASSAIRCVDRP